MHVVDEIDGDALALNDGDNAPDVDEEGVALGDTVPERDIVVQEVEE